MATAIKNLVKSSRVHSVETTLRLTYGIVPIVAGLDKFTNFLTNWSQYLNEDLLRILPFDAGTFMIIVGVIEIAAGVLVLIKTELGAYVVAAWLTGIALTLIVSLSYLDVAVRDLVMAIGAVSLAQLTRMKEHPDEASYR